jgi:plastocyanin
MSTRMTFAAALGASLSLLACDGSGSEREPTGSDAATSTAAPAPATSSVPLTGNVIEVKMVTDDKGNYFEPADFEARRGDVVRFVLVSGVHNVSFPAAENLGKGDLPPPSDYLQLPGQTYDLVIDMAPGDYFYQCDPHAALGMVGTITVTGS